MRLTTLSKARDLRIPAASTAPSTSHLLLTTSHASESPRQRATRRVRGTVDDGVDIEPKPQWQHSRDLR
jgi:hypothetical protein